MKHKYGANIPIQTIGLQLYDVEGCDPSSSPVQRVQWLSYGPGPGQVLLQGEKILIVDEVSWQKLRYCFSPAPAPVAC